MTKEQKYIAALREIDIRLEKGGDLIADLGNVTAVLKKRFSHYFWVGFYFYKNPELILGPFQGNPACVRLTAGQGVCQTAANSRKTVLVPDVHRFEGHIACDPASQSEIVVPCFDETKNLTAVLDVDSAEKNAFDPVDQEWLEKLEMKLRTLWKRNTDD